MTEKDDNVVSILDTVWLKIPEIAKKLGISRMTVYRLIHNGELPAHQFNAGYRVSEKALEDYIKASVFVPDENSSYRQGNK